MLDSNAASDEKDLLSWYKSDIQPQLHKYPQENSPKREESSNSTEKCDKSISLHASKSKIQIDYFLQQNNTKWAARESEQRSKSNEETGNINRHPQYLEVKERQHTEPEHLKRAVMYLGKNILCANLKKRSIYI